MNVAFIETGLFAVILLFEALSLWIMPELSRRDLLFGVTVSDGARDGRDGRTIILRYRLGVALIAILYLVALAAVLAFAPAALAAGILPSILILLATLSFLPAYFIANRASHSLTARVERSAQPPSARPMPMAELRRRSYSNYVGWSWELLPLGIIAATAIYLVSRYASAPAVIATHFDAAGNPDRYSPKTILTYFSLVWTQVIIYVMITALSLLVVGSKVVAGGADEGFRVIWLRVIFGIKCGTIALLGFISAAVASASAGIQSPLNAWVTPLTVLLVLALLVVLIVISLRTGQGGSRLRGGDQAATDRMDDRNWKWGIFYVNSDDSSIMVERRYGIGWTFNFGNRLGLTIFIAILALPIVLALLSVTSGGH